MSEGKRLGGASNYFFFKFHLEVWGRLRPDTYFSDFFRVGVPKNPLTRPSGYQFAFVLPVGFVYFGALYGIMLHPVWKLKFLESFHEKKKSDCAAMNLGTPTKKSTAGEIIGRTVFRSP